MLTWWYRRCPKSRLLVFFIPAGLSVLLASCSGGRQAVYPVDGKVFDSNDQPATGALVVLHPVNASGDVPTKPVGHVDDKGSFSLTTYANGDGAPEGTYVVTIEWRPAKTNPFQRAGTDRLGGKYSNPKSSPLRVEITKGGNHLKPFKLE